PLERRLAGERGKADGAVHLDDRAVAGERLDVAPHRLQRHAETVGEPGDGDGALLLQEAENLAVALGVLHELDHPARFAGFVIDRLTVFSASLPAFARNHTSIRHKITNRRIAALTTRLSLRDIA